MASQKTSCDGGERRKPAKRYAATTTKKSKVSCIFTVFLLVKSMKKPTWLSDQILTAIQEHDRLKKELEKGRILKASFNAARNKVVRLIEKAKKEAVINEIENSKLNSRVLWKTLKSIFPTNARQLSRINSVKKIRNQLYFPGRNIQCIQ